MKILLVEDEKFILDFYLSEFESEMPEDVFFKALNGEEALQVLIEEEINIVLTDGKMPKLDGVQLAYKIKENYPKIKVIMVTGYAGDYSKEEISKSGILKVYDKPVDFEELIQFIKELA
ncbi:MAG: response regulator [Halobacteriovoraceae bacterium]|nr:response regulator [Halobacteriovoraceae bacterium]